MADNLDRGLDADILQCRMDILRIRQSIVNSRSGEVVGQEVRAADTAAGLRAEIETSSQQEHEASPAPAAEPVPQANPYAVTRDEIDALLNSEADESPEVAEQPARVEDEPVQVADHIDALFGDEVAAEQVEEYFDEVGDVASVVEEELAIAAQTPDEAAEVGPTMQKETPVEVEMSPEPVAETEPAAVEDAPVVPEEPVEVQADIQEIAPAAQEDLAQVAAEIVRPEIEAPEPELSEIVAEAEDWMAQIAPEDEQKAVAPSDFDIDSPALEPAVGEAGSGRFDEVVLQLQGEEPIVPVEEEDVAAEQAEVIAEGKYEQEDVKLRIIKDMKGESEKSDEERAGIPRLDLSESDLAGIVESRKNASATRKGPGKREKLEALDPKLETTEAESQISDMKEEMPEEEASGAAAKEQPMVTEVAMSTREKMRLEKEKQVIARIVAKDIERFCASAARLREKERAGQR